MCGNMTHLQQKMLSHVLSQLEVLSLNLLTFRIDEKSLFQVDFVYVCLSLKRASNLSFHIFSIVNKF